jgi:hypothetical protein
MDRIDVRAEVQRLVITQMSMFPEHAPNRRTIHKLERAGIKVPGRDHKRVAHRKIEARK